MTNPSIFKAPSQAPRIHLGILITPDADHENPILAFGNRAHKTPGVKGSLRVVRSGEKVGPIEIDSITEKWDSALVDLRKNKLPKEDGPYADQGDLVAKMVSELLAVRPTDKHDVPLEKLPPLEQMAMIAFDILRPRVNDQFGEYLETNVRRTLVHPDYHFVHNPDHNPELVLPTAGAILSDASRVVIDNVTGASERIIAHPFEAITLTVACLREIAKIKNITVEIFPAFAVSRNLENPDREERIPVVVIHDPSADKPLVTFGLTPIYPRVGSLDVLSDAAALGFLQGLLAHNTISTAFMSVSVEFGRTHDIDDSKIKAAAESVGVLLAHFHANYPGDLVYERLGSIEHEAGGLFTTIISTLAEEKFNDLKISYGTQLSDARIAAKKQERADQLVNAAIAKKRSGMFGFLKSRTLPDSELEAIGAQVDREFADHVLSREELLAIGEEIEINFASDSAPAQNLRISTARDISDAVTRFIGDVQLSMARELERLGVRVGGEDDLEGSANDSE